MTKYKFDEIHYPLRETDIDTNSIHTQSFGVTQSGVSVQALGAHPQQHLQPPPTHTLRNNK